MAKNTSRLKPRPSGSFVVTIRLTLLPGRDDDLIAALTAAPLGALAGLVRELMRSGAGALGQLKTTAEGEDPEPDLAGIGFDL